MKFRNQKQKIVYVFSLIFWLSLENSQYNLIPAGVDNKSLAFSWGTDILTNSIPNFDNSKFYSYNTRQGIPQISIIDFNIPTSISMSTINVNNDFSDTRLILFDDYALATDLRIFSLISPYSVISNNSVLFNNNTEDTKKQIFIYGFTIGNFIIINPSFTINYLFTRNNKELIKISEINTTIYDKIWNQQNIISSKKDTIFYTIINEENSGNFLIGYDYSNSEIKQKIFLNHEGTDLQNFKLCLSFSEEFIVLYTDLELYFYKNIQNSLIFIKNITFPNTALAVFPYENKIIVKPTSRNKLSLFSLENAEILTELEIKEKDPILHIFVRNYNMKNAIIFSDFINCYAYYLDIENSENSNSLVNTYVILMSVLLTIAMIVAIIYIIYSKKTRQNANISNPSNSNNVGNRSQAYQIQPPRTLDTHLVTDLNETNVAISLQNDSAMRKLLVCPLTGLAMKEPVVASDGYTYEKEAIEQWFKQNSVSPITHEMMPNKILIPNKPVASLVTVQPTTQAQPAALGSGQ